MRKKAVAGRRSTQRNIDSIKRSQAKSPRRSLILICAMRASMSALISAVNAYMMKTPLTFLICSSWLCRWSTRAIIAGCVIACCVLTGCVIACCVKACCVLTGCVNAGCVIACCVNAGCVVTDRQGGCEILSKESNYNDIRLVVDVCTESFGMEYIWRHLFSLVEGVTTKQMGAVARESATIMAFYIHSISMDAMVTRLYPLDSNYQTRYCYILLSERDFVTTTCGLCCGCCSMRWMCDAVVGGPGIILLAGSTLKNSTRPISISSTMHLKRCVRQSA